MRKLLIVSLLLAATPALAGSGGMGDPSTHLREMNALCEKQKRGEAPRNPDVCLPEYPPGIVEAPHKSKSY